MDNWLFVIAIFIFGFAAGIAWYKFFLINILRKFPYTMCDYCEFRFTKEMMHPDRER